MIIYKAVIDISTVVELGGSLGYTKPVGGTPTGDQVRGRRPATTVRKIESRRDDMILTVKLPVNGTLKG